MNPPTPSAWLHRFAWVTAALTLVLAGTTGAIVTTLKAGMVFTDWPSSDGYSMLTYPLLNADRDQFVEHGHRLSGMTIGLSSLLLVVLTWCLERRRSVRGMATLIFFAVCAQGLLGGARVLLDRQTLALLHGDFAALVFSLMGIMVLITGKEWESRHRETSIVESQAASNSALFLLIVLASQYVMGGLLRHLRERAEFAWAWMVHPWFALVVLFATIFFVFTVRCSESIYVRRCATALIVFTVTQSLIGLATWYVRYGVPSLGVVAQQDSLMQIAVCSVHKVVGLLTLMTGVLSVFCCWSVTPVNVIRQSSVNIGASVAGVTQ